MFRFFTCLFSFISLCFIPALTQASPHDHHHPASMAKPGKINLAILKINSQGQKKQVFIKLSDAATGSPIRLSALKTVHTEKIHVLVIDETLEDYSHLHPTATKTPGVYEFTWYPKRKEAGYTLWADIVPKNTNQQEYLRTTLSHGKAPAKTIDTHTFLESQLNGMKAVLSFDTSTLQSNKAAMGRLLITDAKGQPFKQLQPIMGAYAHIVGFSDDRKNIVHVHPMGKEPTSPQDRGGPELHFHMQADHPGFIKLFAQVKIDEKEYFFPFGIKIEK